MFEQHQMFSAPSVAEPAKKEERVFVLDGYNSGITAYIFSENSTIKPNNDRAPYFTNYKILESTLLQAGYERLDYDIKFILATERGHFEVPLENTYYNKIKGGWEVLYDLDDDIGNSYTGFIKPKYVNTVTSIGYIRTNRSDTRLILEKKSKDFKELSRKFNANKLKEIFDIVSNSVGLMTTYPKYDIYRCPESTEDKIILGLRGTTGRIIITSNHNIIDFNEKKRKANGLRCLPFNKNMDKFGTLYIYTTMDINDNEFVKDRLYRALMDLMKICLDSFPSSLTHYERLEFSGYINIEEV